MNNEYLTIQEAATFFRVSTRTLRRWEEKGYLTSHRTFGNQRRYSKAQLSQLLGAAAAAGEADVQVSEQTNTAKPFGFQSQPQYVPQKASIAHPNPIPVHSIHKQIQPEPTHIQTLKPEHRFHKPQSAMTFGAVIAIILLSTIAVIGFSNAQTIDEKSQAFISFLKPGETVEQVGGQSVLAAEDRISSLQLQVDVPAVFAKKVTFLDAFEIKNSLTVNSASNLFGGIKTNNKDIDAGTGQLTASNVVYSVLSGTNISITGDPQNPVISAQGGVNSVQGLTGTIAFTSGNGIDLDGLEIVNTGVLSLQGESGDVAFTGGTGIGVNGLTITNTDPGSAQKIFGTIRVGSTNISAGSNTDTFTISAGAGITLAPDAGNKTLTITSNAAGVLSGMTTNGVLYATSATTATSTGEAPNGFILKSMGPGNAPQWVAPGTVLGYLPFDFLTDGTNTTANMIVGTGASLGYTGSGTINASSLQNATWVAPGAIGSSTPNTGAFTALTATTLNGLTVTANGANTLNIATGKTITLNNSLSLSGTDGTVFTFPSANDTLVGRNSTDTLTNKTIAAGSNTITGLTNSNLSGSAGITNANLQNSSLTVTAGSGLSGGGLVSLGGSVSLQNAGVTSATAGTGISINVATGDITVTNNGVTSAVAGTGIGVSGPTGAITFTNNGVTSLTGTANQVNVSGSTGGITLSLPQNIHTAATPTFAGLTLSNLTANGGILYTNGTGTVAQTSVGSPGQCLTSNGGGAPSWSTCAGSSYWNLSNGTLSPVNNTLDLLVGGTSSNSAKFAVLNVNSGTPVASISAGSAGAAYLTATGTLQTTANQTLSLGGNTTGNIILNGDGSNNVGIGTLNPTFGLDVATVNGARILFDDGLGDPRIHFSQVGDNPTQDFYRWTGSGSNYFASRFNVSPGTGDGIFNIQGANDTNMGSHTFSDLLSIVLGGPNQGNVGLGNSAPSQFLDMVRNQNESTMVSLANTDSGAFAYTMYRVANDTGNGEFGIGSSGNNDFAFANRAYLYASSATNGLTLAADGSGDDIRFYTGGYAPTDERMRIDSAGNVGIGASLPLATLDVRGNSGTTPVTSVSGITAQATLLVDNNGVGDLFTASKSGATRFSIANNGNLIATGTLTGLTGLTTSGTVTLSSLTTDGGIMFTNGSGTISQTSAGGLGQCLMSSGGGVPTWGTCAGGTNLWQSNNGTISPFSSALDLLVGGTSTASAKFRFINANSGTPTASISANSGNNAAYLSGTGILSTTNAQTLTLGSATTGNVVVDSGSGLITLSDNTTVAGNLNLQTGNAFQINGTNVLTNNTLGSGVTTSSLTTVGALANGSIANGFGTIFTSNTIQGSNITASGTTGFTASGNGAGLTFSGTGNHDITASSGTLRMGDVTFNGVITTGLTGNNAALYAVSGTGTLAGATTNTQNLCLLSGVSAPAWGSCPIGANYWNQNNGALSPMNSTVDFLLGGQASSSAKFAVLGMNSGTPTASVSATSTGNGLSLAGDGTIQTLRNNTLTLGGSTTGNILLMPTNGSGRVGIGTATPQSTLDVNGTVRFTNQLNFTDAVFGQIQTLVGNAYLDFKTAAGTGAITFTPNATEAMRISPNGMVGIGTNGLLTPFATLDVRGRSGTSPIASLSGATSQASLVIDQSGVGDLFTASKSGLTRFVIDNAGNVKVGTQTSGASLQVTGMSGYGVMIGGGAGGGNTIDGTLNGVMNQPLWLNSASAQDVYIAPNGGSVGIGTSAPAGALDVRGNSGTAPAASFSGQTSRAAMVVDNNGTGDIFTASKSGASKFTILNNGNLQVNNYTTNGGVLYTNASGVVGQTAAGSGGQCLQSNGGGAPTWGSCTGGMVNYWQQNNGAVSPANSTNDFIIGGTATSSARFSVTGMSYTLGGVSSFNSANALPSGRTFNGVVSANGYIYSIGGYNGGGQSTVYYASLNADGSVGDWRTTSALPTSLSNATAVVYNGYVYVAGGQVSVTLQNKVYYARLNTDGTLGSWQTGTNLPQAIQSQSSVVANGYLYMLGGSNNVINNNINTIYYTKINADGSIGAWVTNGTNLPAATRGHTSVVANGYVYMIGGNASGGTTNVYYAKLNGDGSVGSWTSTNGLPAARVGHSSMVANGFVYAVGGDDTSNAQDEVYYAKLNDNGSLGTWSTNQYLLPGVRGNISKNGVIENGYMYVLGGSTTTSGTSGIQSTVYYASTARISMNANLDLIGLSGGNIASASGMVGNGSVGGSIYAGNIFSNGSLTVAGSAQLWNGLSVNGNQTLNGSLNIFGSNGTTPAASVSASTAGAAMVVDNTGVGDLFTASKSGATKFVIKNNGNVGIGTDNPTFPLQVEGISSLNYVTNPNIYGVNIGGGILFSQYNTGTAENVYLKVWEANAGFVFENNGAATNEIARLTGTGSFGLGTSNFTNLPDGSLHLGNGAICVDDGGSNCDDASRVAGRIYAESSTVTAIDLAENYPSKDNTMEPGDVVIADPNNTEYVKRSEGSYQGSVIGIISTKPGILLGGFGDEEKRFGNDKKYPIALAGRIPTKVSTENGPIKPGDYLTSSSIPGVAMKATQAGTTIAKAVEAYDNSDPRVVGKVVALVNPSWYDPRASLNSDGNITVDGKQFNPQLAQDQNTAMSDYSFNARTATSSALTDVTNKTNVLQQMLSVLTQRVDTLETNASSSAFMTSAPGGFVSSSAAELDLEKLDVNKLTVTDTLAVVGRTTLADVGVTGKVNIGLLSIEGLDDEGSAAINTSVGTLRLQSNGLNGIDILNGKMTIDAKGNLKTVGEITAKKVNIDTEEVASASLGEVILKSGQTKVTVKTTALSEKSKIFVQAEEVPVTTAVKKVSKDTFEIRVRSAEDSDVSLSWWIVN